MGALRGSHNAGAQDAHACEGENNPHRTHTRVGKTARKNAMTSLDVLMLRLLRCLLVVYCFRFRPFSKVHHIVGSSIIV